MNKNNPLNSLNKNIDQNSFGKPFWYTSENKGISFLVVLKLIWKWFKLLIFLFMMFIGLWGCFQTMWDSTVTQGSTIGSGLEYGFPFLSTGDYRYDVMSSITAGQYTTFTFWSMQYGPFYGFFVWPVAYVMTNFMWVTKNWPAGLNAFLGIIILLIVIRLLTLLISLNSTLQNERMFEIQGKLSEINAKYKGLKDMQSRQMKQKEMTNLYKKFNIKPFASFQQMFLTMPIFLIIYRVVTIVRPIKVTVLFNIWGLTESPLTQIFNNFTSGGWTYIFFVLIVGTSQFFSMKLPQIWSRTRNRNAVSLTQKGDQALKRNKMIQNIFMFIMCAVVVVSACGVGIYWFLNSLISILQAYIIHVMILKKRSSSPSNSPSAFNFKIE